MAQKKKVVLFGLGSIGRRHARLLRRRRDVELYAFRSSLRAEPNELGIPELFRWPEMAELQPEIALIANPTDHHIETAARCAELGMDLFIEKPLGHRLDGLSRLKTLCRRRGLTTYVAYCLRFHPVIKRARAVLAGQRIEHARLVCSSYLPDWRGRETYSSFAAQGGGVLLDLSHELDYADYLFGPLTRLSGNFGRSGRVTRDAEDYADLNLTGKHGVPVSVHLDYLNRQAERTLKVAFAGGSLSADLLAGTVVVQEGGRRKSWRGSAERDPYLAEQLAYFFDHLGETKLMNNIFDAERLLKMVLELKHGR